MGRPLRLTAISGFFLLLVTCTTPESEPPTTAAGPSAGRPAVGRIFDFGKAVAINVASGNVASGGEHVVVGWTDETSTWIAALDSKAETIDDAVLVSGDVTSFAHRLERPALGVAGDGLIHVAFTSGEHDAGSVYRSSWDGTAVSGPILISGEPRPETNLAYVVVDSDDQPLFAWLEDSTLSVATSEIGGTFEHEELDDLTCDCCNLGAALVNDGLVMAYRNLEHDGDDVIRDLVAIRSEDGGETFTEPVVVADEHWFLDACPFSGPSLARSGDSLLVAWMDARQSLHPDQSSTTIWLDRSTDGGRTFGVDQAIATDAVHRWPMMAIDSDGTLHIVWETQGLNGGISYARSDDSGGSFSERILLLPNDEENGLRSTPSLAVHGNGLVASWIDRLGGHVGLVAPGT